MNNAPVVRAWRAGLSLLGLATIAAVSSAATAPASAPMAASAPSARQLTALCDTCAIVGGVKTENRKGKASGVGAVGGAVAGGVVGHKVGNGGIVGTGVGAVAGGLLGNAIEKRVGRHKVWVTTVTLRDGKTQKFDSAADPHWKSGEIVRIDHGALVRADAARTP